MIVTKILLAHSSLIKGRKKKSMIVENNIRLYRSKID